MALPLVYETLCPRSRSVSANYKMFCGDKQRGQPAKSLSHSPTKAAGAAHVNLLLDREFLEPPRHEFKTYTTPKVIGTQHELHLFVALLYTWVFSYRMSMFVCQSYNSYFTRQPSFTRRAPAIVETLVLDTLTRWRCMYKWTTMYYKSYALVSSWRIKVFIHMVMTPPPLVDANSVFSTQHISSNTRYIHRAKLGEAREGPIFQPTSQHSRRRQNNK